MASDAINQFTRDILREVTKKELLQKVLIQKDTGGKDITIKSKNFESTVKNVLINLYDLEFPSVELDTFMTKFRKTVRRHGEVKKN